MHLRLPGSTVVLVRRNEPRELVAEASGVEQGSKVFVMYDTYILGGAERQNDRRCWGPQSAKDTENQRRGLEEEHILWDIGRNDHGTP